MDFRKARAAYLAARNELLARDAVIGVGFGIRERGGMITREPAVIVLVDHKLPPDQVPPGQRIPATIQGVPADVREPRLRQEQHEEFLRRNGIPPRQGECNLDHFFIDEGKIHQRNLERLRAATEPGDEPQGPVTAVFGEIFVIEDDGTLITDKIDHVGAYELLRTQFGDDYDFVFYHYDTASGVPSQGNSSNTFYNTTTGINHYKGDNCDERENWDSTRIQANQKVTELNQVRRTLHETAHRWCAYVYHQEDGVFSDALHKEFSSTGQAPLHWGTWLDSEASCMTYDYDDWVDSTLVAGEFQKDHVSAGIPGVDEFGYHPLDLYLMGMLSGEELGTFRYIREPLDADGNGSFTGTAVPLTVENVVAQEGARSPAYPDTQRIFHQAFILLTNDLAGIGTLTSGVLGNLEIYRRGLANAFRQATRSRGVLDSSLLHAHHRSLYIRDNSSDQGTSSRGRFWNSPDVWVRNQDDDGTTHQHAIRGQDNYVHARVWNSSDADYADVTVRVYGVDFSATEFYYPDDWHPKNLLGERTLLVPAAGSAVTRVTWSADLIPDETWYTCLLVEVIPLEVTPDHRHHVRDNRKLAQKNVKIADAPEEAGVVSLPFAFGHPSRVQGETALLVVAREDGVEADLLLDAAGLELREEPDPLKLPPPEYLAFVPSHPASADGSGSGLVQVERGGRRVYRLPRRRVLALRTRLPDRGRVMITLHAELSPVPGSADGGVIHVIQCEEDGRVVGGLDVHLAEASGTQELGADALETHPGDLRPPTPSLPRSASAGSR